MKLKIEKSVKSAARALDIIEYVAAKSSPVPFTQIMDELRIPRSSLFHLLNNLLARGYLQQDKSTERYRLGQRIRELAMKVPAMPLAATVQPFLSELARAFDETCGFYVREEAFAIAVASATSGQALSYTMKVGERAPLYAVSAGKALLAGASQHEFDEYIRFVSFEAITPATITTKQRLRQEIGNVRSAGFALSREEFTPGITGLAVAVAAEHRLYGALNLAVPTARFTKERFPQFKRKLTEVSRSLAARLQEIGPAV